MDYYSAINLSKLEFHVKEIVFFKYVINGLEVKIDRANIKTIEEWQFHRKRKNCRHSLILSITTGILSDTTTNEPNLLLSWQKIYHSYKATSNKYHSMNSKQDYNNLLS